MKPLTPEQMAEAKKQVYAELSSSGGKARAASLSPRRRKEIARKAVKARWAKVKEKDAATD